MTIGILLRKDDNKLFINKSYLDYFKKFGDLKLIADASMLYDCDCFVIPGGYDINPSYYNEENKASYNINSYNDEMDFKLIDYAYKNNKPLIGICRGCQSINIYFKGSLYQDILNHNKENHFIKLNDKYLLVNSYHHQAIKKLGDGLNIIAKSTDGVIEIIKNKKITGFQFHPELMNSPVIDSLIIKVISEA